MLLLNMAMLVNRTVHGTGFRKGQLISSRTFVWYQWQCKQETILDPTDRLPPFGVQDNLFTQTLIILCQMVSQREMWLHTNFIYKNKHNQRTKAWCWQSSELSHAFSIQESNREMTDTIEIHKNLPGKNQKWNKKMQHFTSVMENTDDNVHFPFKNGDL